MVQMVAAAAVWPAAAWPALQRDSGGPCGRCRARAREPACLGSGRAVIWWSGQRRPAMLAAYDPSIVRWVVCASTSMVQDVWRLCACVRDELRTYMCERGSGVAAVAIAVCRETADASRGLKWPEKQ